MDLQAQINEPSGDTLYVRDMVGEQTFRLGGARATYETMSSDGSRVFYLEGGDLYEFDTATRIGERYHASRFR